VIQVRILEGQHAVYAVVGPFWDGGDFVKQLGLTK